MSCPPEIKKEAIALHIQGKSAKEIVNALQPECPEGIVLDERTVRSWIAWYALLEDVITAQVKNRVDPVIIEQRKRHYYKLAEIANSFLAGGLTKIPYDATDEDYIYDLDTGESLIHNELITRLTDNVFHACDRYDRYRVMDWLAAHLESGYLSGKDLFVFIETKPIEFITIVRTLAESKTFKGTCPVCKDW